MGFGRLHIAWISLLTLILPISLMGQSTPCFEPSPKNLKLYEKGISYWQTDNNKAKTLIFKAIENEPQWVIPYYYLARNYYRKAQMIQYDTRKVSGLSRLLNLATDNFEKVIDICPSHDNYKALYYLGKIYYEGGNLSGTYKFLSQYMQNSKKEEWLPKTKIMFDKCTAYQRLVNNPVDFNPIPVEGICTEYDEFMPLISADGTYMFFTRRMFKKRMGDITKQYREEFHFSNFIKWDSLGNPVFAESHPMPYPFNDQRNEGAATITIDNKTMFITVCEQIEMPDGRPYKNCDIYQTRTMYGKWTDFEKLGNGINGITTWEGHPSISADGKTLYFASYRPNGIGGIDIYYSKKDSAGNWTSPVNLGEPINTELNEKSPFIHPDNESLYFSSDGHPGVGGYDIFLARKAKDHWEAPFNIGYPINSTNDESGFIVSTDGQYAYFSGNTLEGVGGHDIFGFELPGNAKPQKVLFIKGRLIDGKGAMIDDADIEIKNMNTNEISTALLDKYTGKYTIAVSAKNDDNYMMTVKKPNYSFTSTIVSTKKDTAAEKQFNMELNFAMKELNVGAKTKLNNILFNTNSAELTSLSSAMLDNFASYLKDNPNIKIRIEGHTDNISDADFNLKLSKKRAHRVYKYLIKQGIKRNRMTYEGYGETQPVADNNTEKGRAKNRRTEFVITAIE